MHRVDTGKVDLPIIEDWALRHGFQKTEGGKLEAPYGEGTVTIELLERNFRVSLQAPGHQPRVLVSGHPKGCHIDEQDMLHGAGLFTRFYTHYREDVRDDPENALMPVWFGDDIRAMVAEHVAKEFEKTGKPARIR